MPISKKQFFCQTLIPAGQLVTLIVAVARHSMKRKDQAALAARLMDPLHLVAAYVLKPTTTDVDALDSVLCEFVVDLAAVFHTDQTQSEGLLELAMETSNYLPWSPDRARLYAAFNERIAAVVVPPALFATVGYSPQARQAWLEEHLCVTAPLMSRGRFNKWLTFVRNGQWDVFARALGQSAAWQLRAHKRFSSRMGREQWAALWQATFPLEAVVSDEPAAASAAPTALTATEAVVVPGPALEPTAVVAPAPVASPMEFDRLPLGVTVGTTADQRLHVQATFVPASVLHPNQRVSLRAAGPAFTHPLAKALAAQEWSQPCSVMALANTILRATEWLAAKKVEASATIPAAYREWRREQQMAALLEKLKVSFVPQEYSLLQEVLTKEMAASST